MVFKITGIIFIIFGGYKLADNYILSIKERIENLMEWNKTVTIMQAKIRYQLCTIEEICMELSDNPNSDIKRVFDMLNKEIKQSDTRNLKVIWENIIDNELEEYKEDDKKRIKMIGYNLGKLDKQMQYENLEMFFRLNDEVIENLKNDYKNKSKVYRTLGFSISLIIVIVLV